MSINKIYLKELKELKKEYKRNPIAFKLKMQRAEALIGNTDSMKFVEKKMKKKK